MRILFALNKADERQPGVTAVSGKTGEGVSELLRQISERLMVKTPQDVVAIRERQITGLRAAETFLERVLELVRSTRCRLSWPAKSCILRSVNWISFLVALI